jgi:hypothetical protein
LAKPFQIDSTLSFPAFLERLFAHYLGSGIQSTGYRLNAMRAWMGMVGRTRAVEALDQLEREAHRNETPEIAKSLWMSPGSYRRLRKFAQALTETTSTNPAIIPSVFVSYRWESGEHVGWVRRLAADLRAHGVNAILDQWEVRYGDSFTDYMQRRIYEADIILFVITPEAVEAAEAAAGEGGALKFGSFWDLRG